MVPVVILNALLASTYTLGKIALNFTHPIFFVGSSMLVGGISLLMYQVFTAPKKLTVHKKDIGLFLQVSFFTIFLSYVLQFWGMQSLPSSKACLLYGFGPFFSYLIAYLFFSEKMSIKKMIGLVIGFGGLFPILMTSSPKEDMLGTIFYISLPEIAVILSAAAYSYGWFVIRQLVHDKHYSPLTVNSYSMITGGLLALACVPILEGPVKITLFYPFFVLLIGTVIIEYIICNNLYALLLDKYSETFLSLSTFSIPIFGAIYGWLFLSETISWHFFLSVLILFFSIKIFYQVDKEEHPRRKAQL